MDRSFRIAIYSFAFKQEIQIKGKIEEEVVLTINLLCCLLQSVPINVLGNYDLTSMTLEYRRECQQSNLLESLTSSTASGTEDSNNYMNRRPDLEFTHLLRMLADKAEIVRARTQWHSKQKLN